MKWNINKKLLKKILKIILSLLVFSIALYWFKFAPVSVEKYQVKKGEISAEAMGTGTLDAKIKMIISSKISGRIKKILVDQGDRVTKGQLLVTLESKEFKLQVEVEEANLKIVESTANKLQKDLEYNQAVLSNAIINYKRYKQLIMEKAISQEKFDNANEEYGIATAKYGYAKEALVEGKNKIVEAEKKLELSKSQLDDSYIKAPFNGIITKRERDPGDIAIPSGAILSLISTKVLWIRAWVGETSLAKIKVGQSAKIIFRSDPNHTYRGNVARVAIKVDSETREFIVDISINKLPINWAIGQRAEVYIETDKKYNVLFIPGKYIRWKEDKPGTFVDNKGSAKWHFIKTGLNNGNFIEVVKGLQNGDNVLNPVNLKNKLKENTRIYIK